MLVQTFAFSLRTYPPGLLLAGKTTIFPDRGGLYEFAQKFNDDAAQKVAQSCLKKEQTRARIIQNLYCGGFAFWHDSWF
jgi:hypothetical protein